MASPTVVRFAGTVSRVPGPGRGGVTLLGRLDEPDPVPAQLSLIDTERLTLPSSFETLSVEALSPTAVLLRSGSGEWRVACRTWQLHRDVGVAFHGAVPPRPTPWTRRLGWRVLLGMAATSPGRWLLTRRAAKKSNSA